VNNARQQADWFFREACSQTDPALKFVAFQQAMGWSGEKDYAIIQQVFEEMTAWRLL
jgi:hypothetical protein